MGERVLCRRRRGALIVLAAALSSAASAVAAEKAAVMVWAIQATKSNDKISPELKPIAKQLKRQVKFTGYRVVKKVSGSVEFGKPHRASLVGGYKAELTPLSQSKGRIKLRAKITERVGKKEVQRVNTSFTIPKGKFQLVGGWKFPGKPDDVLILAISAR